MSEISDTFVAALKEKLSRTAFGAIVILVILVQFFTVAATTGTPRPYLDMAFCLVFVAGVLSLCAVFFVRREPSSN
jgi:uncharacterized membrane protein